MGDLGNNNNMVAEMQQLRKQPVIAPPTIQRQDFEEFCSTIGYNGIPTDFLKCKLFPFSLADKASRWLKSLPPGSLTTWIECRSAFLENFCTKSKTTALKNKISSFKQQPGEAFCKAWERYKEYPRECPHHGFSDEQILATFYDGVNWDYKNALNAASNGNFMTKSKAGAYELIENLAANSSNKSPRNRNFGNFRSHPNLSYRSNNVDNPHEQVYPQQGVQNQSGFQKNFSSNFQRKQFITNQNRFQGGNQQKLPFTNSQPSSSSPNNSQDELKNMMQQLVGKYETVLTHVKKLDVQVAQTAEAVKRPPGTLPRKDETMEHPEPTIEHLLKRTVPANIPARVYTPKVPYPVPPKKSQKDLEEAKCKKMLKDLTVKFPLADAV
ncbi:uncharacterized protein LOC112086504 [Eutrema salsugineum]|uniref:uncharacterized protein LOC112086504 n=1 Tax=Eutrema salsugineum TaxID=72664 RepID=UPI000CED72DF|nr:uncharacterized protein LOC112086504 [Eutrema salsugineum]